MSNSPHDAADIAARLHRLTGLNQTQIDSLSLSLDPVQVDQISDSLLASLVNGTLPGLPVNPAGGLPLGLPGAIAATRWVGATVSGAPTTGAFLVGDFTVSQDGHLWICTTAGSPGTWIDSALADALAAAPDASTSTKGLVKLGGDLGGTAASPTVPGLASKVPKPASGLDGKVTKWNNSTGQLEDASATLNGTYVRTVNGLTADGTGDIEVAAGGSGVSIDGVAQTAVDIASAAPAAADVGAVPQLTPTAVKTANYTAVAGDFVPVDTTSGAVTVTLPSAPADGVRVGVAHIIQGSTNAVTINRGGSTAVFNKAGGSTSVTLPTVNQKMFFTYRATGAIWEVENSLSLGALDLRFAAISGGGASLTNTQKRDLTLPSRGSGVLAWTIRPELATGLNTMVTGAGRFLGAVRLLAGDAHTNIVIPSGTTAGAGITEIRAYLCDTSGVALARSNDLTASLPGGSGAWTASTAMTFPLTSAYTPGADADALVVLLATGTTMPNLPAMAAPTAGAVASGAKLAATWGGNSTASFAAGSFPAVGATIALPTAKTGLSLAHLT